MVKMLWLSPVSMLYTLRMFVDYAAKGNAVATFCDLRTSMGDNYR